MPTATASTVVSPPGDKCGAAAANAYCKTHDFAAAASYRKVDRDDITGAIPVRRLRRLQR